MNVPFLYECGVFDLCDERRRGRVVYFVSDIWVTWASIKTFVSRGVRTCF